MHLDFKNTDPVLANTVAIRLIAIHLYSVCDCTFVNTL